MSMCSTSPSSELSGPEVWQREMTEVAKRDPRVIRRNLVSLSYRMLCHFDIKSWR